LLVAKPIDFTLPPARLRIAARIARPKSGLEFLEDDLIANLTARPTLVRLGV